MAGLYFFAFNPRPIRRRMASGRVSLVSAVVSRRAWQRMEKQTANTPAKTVGSKGTWRGASVLPSKKYAVRLEISCPGGAYYWAPEIPSGVRFSRLYAEQM